MSFPIDNVDKIGDEDVAPRTTLTSESQFIKNFVYVSIVIINDISDSWNQPRIEISNRAL